MSTHMGSQIRRGRVGSLVLVVSLLATLATAVVASPASAGPGDITTVAGGGAPADGVGDGLPATQALLLAPWSVEELNHELYISEEVRDRVRKVDLGGVISTFAGGGTVPLGDGGDATAATLNLPDGIAFDTAGNLFIADTANHRVRRVDVVAGTISTVAGTGEPGFAGDGAAATEAQLNRPLRVAFDGAGNMFVSDSDNQRVRRVAHGGDGSVTGGPGETIVTVAGDGTPATGGDGLPATSAQVVPRGIAVGSDGRLYIADVAEPRVRVVATGGDGTVDGGPGEMITSFAGGGTLAPGGDGEGALATDVAIGPPEALAFDVAGNLYVATVVDDRVLKIDTSGHLMTVAGTGVSSFGAGGVGDGGPATAAEVAFAFGLTVDPANNLFIGELNSSRVRRVVPGADGVLNGGPDEIITTFAGNGTFGFGGDGGPATKAQLNRPADVAAASGNLYIADEQNNRVRKVDPAGIITTVAGGGLGDGLPATSAALDRPRGVVADGAGNVYIADCGHQRVRKVDATGTISTFVGGQVPFRCPSGLHLVTSGPAAGSLYVADAGSNQVFVVNPTATAVTVVAGTGSPGFGGDGGPATEAQLDRPAGVHRDASGNVLIADTENHRVRRISGNGTIMTVAGDGTVGFGRDNAPATASSIVAPTDVVVDSSGALIIPESGFHRLRRVDATGTITSIAGNGIPSFTGDGGPAVAALLNTPTQVDLDTAGNLFFTDTRNRRVRRIEVGSPGGPPSSGCGQVITKSTKLKADIGPCPGDGIVIGADNITLDLKGHTIFGTDGPTGNVGIRLTGRRGVEIKSTGRPRPGGSVRGFDAGVAIIGGSRNTVRDLSVVDNLGPPSIDEATFGDGIGLFFTSDNRILNNRLDNNGPYDGIAVLGITSHRNLIHGNTVTRTNSLGTDASPTGIGIALNPFLSEDLPRELSIFDNRITGNVVRDNDNSGISNISNVNGVVTGNVVENNGLGEGSFPGNGIGVQSLEFAGRNTNVLVRDNRVIGNGVNSFGGDGINVASNGNQIRNNHVHGNHVSGIFVFGQGNSIRDNNAANNVRAPEFFAFDLYDGNVDPDTFEPTCDANVWVRNIWGSGGFFPDCTAVGGHAALGTAQAAQAAEGSRRSPAPRADANASPRYEDLVRGHPPMPR